MDQLDFLATLVPVPPPAPLPPPPGTWAGRQRTPEEFARMRARRQRSLARMARGLVSDPGPDLAAWRCPKCRQGRADHFGCHTLGVGRFLLCSHRKPRRK